jgi:uncharacterized cysteine cluster protein YcgN (CxxCxxCC family)
LTGRHSFDYLYAMKKDTYCDSQWEGLCEQCGMCCFEKLEDDHGTIFFTQTPCRYLDVHTRQCRIYPRRFEINPACVKLTPELVAEIRWLHDDCGYMKAFGRRRSHHRPRKGSS